MRSASLEERPNFFAAGATKTTTRWSISQPPRQRFSSTPLKRFEKTGAITLRNLIAILRATDLLDGLESLIPDAESPSPLDVLAAEKKRLRRLRKRAPPTRNISLK